MDQHQKTDPAVTDQALSDHRIDFKVIVDALPLGVCVMDSSGKYKYFNDAFKYLFGYSVEDIIHEHDWVELAFPDPDQRRQAVDSWHQESVEGRFEQPTPRVSTIRGKDGRVRQTNIIPVSLPNGDKLLTFEDITESLRSEEQRKLDESCLESLLVISQMRDEILAKILAYTSDQCLHLTGSQIVHLYFLKTDDLIAIDNYWAESTKRPPGPALSWVSIEAQLKQLENATLNERQPQIFNNQPVEHGYQDHPDKESAAKRHFLVFPVLDGPQPVMIISVANNYAEYEQEDLHRLTWLSSGLWRLIQRKRTAQALAQSEERYRSLVENTPYGIFMAEIPSGSFLFLNRIALDMFGYRPDLKPPLSIFDFVHPQDRPAVKGRLAELKQGRLVDRETRVYTGLRRDQSTFRFDMTISSVHYQGRLAAQGILRDVTEIEHLERQLQHSQKMEAVGTLANGVAHEFNNILMAIRGYSQMLGAGVEGNPRLERPLMKINENVERAADLTGKLLTFSRLEIGERAALNLNDLIITVTDLFRQTTPSSIEIVTELEPGLPVVLASRVQLEQVFLNMAINSRDVMPNGGRITFRTHLCKLDEIFAQANPWARPGRYVEVEISDTGPGIPSSVLEHIFEPFYTTKAPGYGSGLGLSVTYSMIKNHNGYILAESPPGQGARFRIFLPAGQSALSIELTQPPTPELPVGQGQTILVVDDEEAVRDLCRSTLNTFGYRVVVASNGGEALRLFREAMDAQKPFDLVILDYVMPAMDGGQVAEHLLEMDPQAKVIMVSGQLPVDQFRFTNLGARLVGALEKPFSIQTLITEVARLLLP